LAGVTRSIILGSNLLETNHGLVRGFGLVQATALNMSNMVGVGPFITIPLIIASMGGPQCMLGWLLGAVLALCDGLVWSELAAAMPGTGGSYLYLREAFRTTRLGGLLPFLFIWQFVFSGPLEIGSGYIGFVQYVGYFWRGMGPGASRWIAAGAGTLVIALLYRKITAIGRLTVVLWIGMLATVAWIIVSGAANFHPAVAFDFPPNAFTFTRGFAAGLGSAMLIAMYDFMGYYDICYVGGEVRNPERVIPRSIMYSVIAVAVIYALCNLSIIAVVPWREAVHSKFIASEFIERLYGTRAASAVTVLVLWTALASVFALLLGYSRIPYAAAVDGHFFKVFARLHPTGNFPHISLLVMGALSIVASFWSLDAVISALLTSRILIQFIGQIFALYYLRKDRRRARPFRMWMYPLPSVIAFAGWSYIFLTSGWGYAGFGLLTLFAGVAAYWLWKRLSPAGERVHGV
jgi:APA family basic amino acid/polyamine antiporter